MSQTKVAIVTGSSRGIGYEIVKKLCKRFPGVVYLTSRKEEDGRTALENLSKLGLKPEYHQLDVTDEESVLKLTKYIEEKHGGVDILVNNAAVPCWTNSTAEFVEKANVCIRTNFFGLVAVCKSMFPLLKSHARIVNVSSCEGHLSKIPGRTIRSRLSDSALTMEGLTHLVNEYLVSVKAGTYNEDGWGPNPYRVSKAAVCALTFLQQKGFEYDSRTDIVVNTVHPGFCATNMTRNRGPLTAEQGADAPTYLALLPPNITQPKGQFVWKDRSVVSWVEPLKERF